MSCANCGANGETLVDATQDGKQVGLCGACVIGGTSGRIVTDSLEERTRELGGHRVENEGYGWYRCRDCGVRGMALSIYEHTNCN